MKNSKVLQGIMLVGALALAGCKVDEKYRTGSIENIGMSPARPNHLVIRDYRFRDSDGDGIKDRVEIDTQFVGPPTTYLGRPRKITAINLEDNSLYERVKKESKEYDSVWNEFRDYSTEMNRYRRLR